MTFKDLYVVLINATISISLFFRFFFKVIDLQLTL